MTVQADSVGNLQERLLYWVRHQRTSGAQRDLREAAARIEQLEAELAALKAAKGKKIK
jgi:hypothetical protein